MSIKIFAAPLTLSIFALVLLGNILLISPVKIATAATTITPRAGLDMTASRVDAFKDQLSQNYDSAFFATAAGRIIGVILSFVGILFLALMIYAGITWMLAGGNEQTISKSKDLLVNAVIGLIIVFAAYAITIFVSQQFIA